MQTRRRETAFGVKQVPICTFLIAHGIVEIPFPSWRTTDGLLRFYIYQITSPRSVARVTNQALLDSLERDRDRYRAESPVIPTGIVIVSGDIVHGVKHRSN